MAEPISNSSPDGSRHEPQLPRGIWGLKEWFWFILKNVVGWLLMLLAWPVGLALPGPGGLPLFLIGFALITFPGKRNLTARVLRGIPVNRNSRTYQTTLGIIAIVLPALVLVYLRYIPLRDLFKLVSKRGIVLSTLYVCGVAAVWIVGLRSDRPINFLLRYVPRIRRRVRPWMRRKGLDLLPPRRRRRATHGPHSTRAPDEGILEIHERHHHRLQRVWASLRVGVRRGLGIAITLGIFFWMFKPVYLKWDEVKEPLSRIDWKLFAVGAAMFAVFLFVFRVLSWRRILIGLGHRLPIPAATRIWSTSELARYLPGMIWQVVGRVYLCRPYGVSGGVCSTSQILELIIFLLANIVVAATSLLFLGAKVHRELRPLLYGSMALVPVLLLLLHPKIFYSLVNRIMRWIKRPPMTLRLRKRELLGLGLWAVLGLLWQSLAIYAVTSRPLGLKPDWWWIVAGGYCLAWCAGFLAFWAPGGLGVRELVFVMAMELAMPAEIRARLPNPEVREGFLAFIGVLLRLWATAGELILATIAYSLDLRGAMNHPDAPGRIDNSAENAIISEQESAPAQSPSQPTPRTAISK